MRIFDVNRAIKSKDVFGEIRREDRADQILVCRNERMWLSKTSFLLMLVGLASSDKDSENDASSVFIEEAKNLFSQESIENMAHAFAHSDAGKQVDKNS